MHFAAFKAVGESVSDPLKYYHNNVQGTAIPARPHGRAQRQDNRFQLVSHRLRRPGDRSHHRRLRPHRPTNPYGTHEARCRSVAARSLRIRRLLGHLDSALLQPGGRPRSGEIGEDPLGIPANLMPYITQVAVGRRPHLEVFGDDYPTPDGTGIRDYIHVIGPGHGHIKALEYLASGPALQFTTSAPASAYSVLGHVRAFEQATGLKNPLQDRRSPRGRHRRRASPTSPRQRDLGWTAELDWQRMCADHWRWQSSHPRRLCRQRHRAGICGRLNSPTIDCTAPLVKRTPRSEGWLSGRKHWS